MNKTRSVWVVQIVISAIFTAAAAYLPQRIPKTV